MRDALPQAERVMLRSTESLPAVDHLVVHKTERRLVLLHGETVVRSYKIALGLNPVGHEGARRRFPHSRGTLLPRPPQSAQRLLSIHPGLLSERDRYETGAQESLGQPADRS